MKINGWTHNDHGVPVETLSAVLAAGQASGEVPAEGFFLVTLPVPEWCWAYSDGPLMSNLYGPAAGDPPVKGTWEVREEGDAYRQGTPFVDLPPRPTHVVTVIGIVESDGGARIFTAYGGPAAARIPSDPGLAKDPEGKAAAEKFWSEHALSIAAKK